jgi:MFS family permease
MGFLGGFRGLPRAAWLLIGAGSVFWVLVGLYSVSLPIYLKRAGYDELFIGFVLTLTGLVAVLLVVPFGLLADRFGRKRLMMIGAVANVASGAILAAPIVAPTLSGHSALFLGFAVVAGFAEAAFFSTWGALLADSAPAARRTAVFGLSFFFSQLAGGGGNVLGSLADYTFTASLANLETAYGMAFGITAVIAALALFFLRAARVHEELAAEGAPAFRLPRKSRGIIGKFLASNLIIGFGAGIVIPLFTLWFFLRFGLAETFTGPLLGISAVVNAFAFLVAPAIADRYGFVRTIVSVSGVATVLLVLIPIVPDLLVVGILFVVRNALMNMTWPVSTAFLMNTVDASERSAASAVTGAAFRLPFAVSTTIGGALLGIDLSLPFFITGMFYAIGVATFWAFFRNFQPVGAKATAPT